MIKLFRQLVQVKFFKYLYCQVYSNGSGATHRTSAVLEKSTVWTKSMVGNLNFIEPKPNMNHLVFASIHSLTVYLASIRFVSQILEGMESYYQSEKEAARIITGSLT